MNSEILNVVIGAIFVGAGATLIMDLWAIFLSRAFNISAFNFCLLGRWLSFMADGVFRHHTIMNAKPRTAECTLGWLAHYVIGIAYATVLVLPASGEWLLQPSLVSAMVLSLLGLVFPFFIMQPALGFGVAAAKTPKPVQARIKSVVTHSVFGLGLYLSALLLHYVAQIF